MDLNERLHALAAGLAAPAAELIDQAIRDMGLMTDAICEVAAKLDAWAEDQRRVYCSTIDTAMKAKAMNRCDGYTDLAQRLRAALPKERQ